MDKTKVFNPGPSEIAYDSAGHVLDAHAWADVDESDRVTRDLLASRRLRRAAAPARATRKTATTANGEK